MKAFEQLMNIIASLSFLPCQQSASGDTGRIARDQLDSCRSGQPYAAGLSQTGKLISIPKPALGGLEILSTFRQTIGAYKDGRIKCDECK